MSFAEGSAIGLRIVLRLDAMRNAFFEEILRTEHYFRRGR
jgi:hypothetical protein